MTNQPAELKIAESLGAMLSRTRLGLDMELETVAKELGVPLKQLEQMEADDWARLPDDAYTRIYFKSYCRYLRLNGKSMLGLYQQVRQRIAATHQAAKAAEETRRHPNKAIPAWQMLLPAQMIRNGLIGLVGIGLVGYFWWAVATIVTPPKIAVLTPNEGMVTEERTVTVTGQTEDEVSLRINGKEAPLDSEGHFQDEMDLAEGLNVIKVVGSKRHSKETVVTRRIIVSPPDVPTAEGPGFMPGL